MEWSEVSVSLTDLEKLLPEVKVLLLAEAGVALNHLFSNQTLF